MNEYLICKGLNMPSRVKLKDLYDRDSIEGNGNVLSPLKMCDERKTMMTLFYENHKFLQNFS